MLLASLVLARLVLFLVVSVLLVVLVDEVLVLEVLAVRPGELREPDLRGRVHERFDLEPDRVCRNREEQILGLRRHARCRQGRVERHRAEVDDLASARRRASARQASKCVGSSRRG